MLEHVNKQWGTIIEGWVRTQWGRKRALPPSLRGIADVFRWSDYRDFSVMLEGEEYLKTHWITQSSAQHTLGLVYLVHETRNRFLMQKSLRDYKLSIDWAGLETTAYEHDKGERRLGDTNDARKTVERDVQEYLDYSEDLKVLPWDVADSLEAAYLLQHAANPEKFSFFPSHARLTLLQLYKTRLMRASLFDYHERIDYLLFVYHLYQKYANPYALVWTLRRQVPKLDILVEQYPVLGALYWKPEIRQDFVEFLEAHTFVPAEDDLRFFLDKSRQTQRLQTVA